MNHRRKVVCPLKFNFQTGYECLLHERHILLFGGINVLHQEFTMIDRRRERDHARRENFCRCEGPRFHDREAPDDIGHEPAHLLIIANVIARQL